MFNDINGVDVVLKEMLGKCHGAASFAVARGMASHPKR